MALCATFAACATTASPPLRYAFEPPPIVGFRYGPAAIAVHGQLIAVVDAAARLDKGPARLLVFSRDSVRVRRTVSITIRDLPTSASFSIAFESPRILWLAVSGSGGAHVARFVSNANGSNWSEEWETLPSVGPIPAIASGEPGTLYLLDAEFYRIVELVWHLRRRRPIGSAREIGAPHGLWYHDGRVYTLFLTNRIELVAIDARLANVSSRVAYPLAPGEPGSSVRSSAARWREGLFAFDAKTRTLFAHDRTASHAGSQTKEIALWLPDRHPWFVGGVDIRVPNLAAADGNRLCFASSVSREVRCYEAVFRERTIGGGPLPKTNR